MSSIDEFLAVSNFRALAQRAGISSPAQQPTTLLRLLDEDDTSMEAMLEAATSEPPSEAADSVTSLSSRVHLPPLINKSQRPAPVTIEGNRRRQYRQAHQASTKLTDSDGLKVNRRVEAIVAELELELKKIEAEHASQQSSPSNSDDAIDLPLQQRMLRQRERLLQKRLRRAGAGPSPSELKLQLRRLAVFRRALHASLQYLPADVRQVIEAAAADLDQCVNQGVEASRQELARSDLESVAEKLAAHNVVVELRQQHTDLEAELLELEQQIDIENNRLAKLKANTTKAKLTTAMSHISARQIARDADFRQYSTETAQYLHGVNLETSIMERRMRRMVQLRRNACVPLKVLSWVQDTLDAAMGKLKYWQKQCELLQMDLHELQGQLSEEDRRLAENLSDDEDQHKSEA